MSHKSTAGTSAVAVELQPLDPVKLGAKFAQLMSIALSPEQLQEVNERNKAEGMSGCVCASHDFMDANMIMLEAMESFGHELEPESDDQARAMNTAWMLAQRALFDEQSVTPELLQKLQQTTAMPAVERTQEDVYAAPPSVAQKISVDSPSPGM